MLSEYIAAMVDLGAYKFKCLNIGIIRPKTFY